MNNTIYKKLVKLVGKSEMISVYRDKENTDKFSIGYISAINRENYIIQHIDPSGLYDGFLLEKTESIYMIEEDDLYKEKILKLCKAHNTKIQDVSFNGSNLTVSLLQFACDNNYIVSIETNNGGYTDAQGFVVEVDEDNVVIAQVTEFGVNNGTANVDISSINRIDCNTDTEQTLKILSDNQPIK